ncbi:HNH endonuclease [Boseaceae bacterium BT-24-1]|nr:HNH endonuclease [Boseaceae bacterium BT-24-1]
MADCIFCSGALDRHTKPEHVLLNAMGGRKTTTRVICSSCNNQFGNGIDKALAAQAEIIRNVLQMESGTGNPAPMLRKVKAGTDVVNLRGGGTLDLVSKPFSFAELPDGRASIQINAGSLEQIERLIPSIVAASGIPEAEIRSQLSAASARRVERRPGAIHIRLAFGGQDAIRSAAKACLVLWALRVENDEVRGPMYEAARDCVTTGRDNFHKNRTALDTRLPGIADQITQHYGPIFNLIYVRSNAAGRVIGHFTFYNLLGFQFVLAESGGTPEQAIALVSNPLSPTTWSVEAADLFDIPFDWLDRPEFDQDFVVQRQRISEAYRPLGARARRKERDRIIDAVCDDCGLGESDPVSDSVRIQIFSEIIARCAAHALSLPFEKPIKAEQMRATFGGRSPDGE